MPEHPVTPVPPEQCQTMSEVRTGVDAVDADLIALLSRRFGYMRAAARIKGDRDLVRDEPRKAEVIANARRHAQDRGIPAELVADLWERLVEGSISYEFDCWDEGRSGRE